MTNSAKTKCLLQGVENKTQELLKLTWIFIETFCLRENKTSLRIGNAIPRYCTRQSFSKQKETQWRKYRNSAMSDFLILSEKQTEK